MAHDKTADILGILCDVADEHADGHFSIFKFTTNWKVVLDTHSATDIMESVPAFKTLREAVAWAIKAGRVPYKDAQWDDAAGEWQQADDPLEEAYKEGYIDGQNDSDIGSTEDWRLCVASIVESIHDGHLKLSGDKDAQIKALEQWVAEATTVPDVVN